MDHPQSSMSGPPKKEKIKLEIRAPTQAAQEPQTEHIFEKVLVQLQERLVQKDRKIRELEAKLLYERDQSQSIIESLQDQLSAQTESYQRQISNLTKKFGQQMDMCNRLMDLALRTGNELSELSR